ncbi:MAG: DUF5924 family protein [bacterium]
MSDPDAGAPSPDAELLRPTGLFGGVRRFLARHHKKLWWLHSAYALGLGVFIITFAARGLLYVRWILLFVVAAWLISLLVFRVAGSGRHQKLETPVEKLRFLVMTYVLKNLYQGMLFFLLPFYWQTATAGTAGFGFLVLLAACTLLATLDVVFDRVLMRWRLLASLYYGMALFACLNLAIPALLLVPAVWSLSLAAVGATIGFWTLHFRPRHLRRPVVAAVFGATLFAAWGAAWLVRRAIPPVPLTLAHAAVGPDILVDGRLAYEVTALHESLMQQMVAVTDVQTLVDAGEEFVHVWRRNGTEILRLTPSRTAVEGDRVRLRSRLLRAQLPSHRAGPWTVDVETQHGQLIGRFGFRVSD